MIFGLTVLIFCGSVRKFDAIIVLYIIKGITTKFRGYGSERFIDKFLGLFGEAPAGEGLGSSQEMVVKRWKVYKRLLFPCGVVTECCSMACEPKTPALKATIIEKPIIILCKRMD